MKRKLYLVLLFIFFLFLFDRGAAFLFREINHSFYANTELKKDIFGKMRVIKKGFFDTMIFGSSRTKQSVHPLYLLRSLGVRAYKEAKPSRYPKYYYNFYRKFRSVYGKPEFLIYGIDYFIFNLRTSNMHLFSVIRKKKKTGKLDFKKMRNETNPLLNRSSLVFRAKKKIDGTVSDLIYKLSMDWDSPEKDTNLTGIDVFTGKERALAERFRRKPRTWEKFRFLDSSHGEGKYLRMLFDELENDGVKVILVGIPDYIGTYMSNFQQDRFDKHIRSMVKGRNDFLFINYNDPGKFDLYDYRNFTDGGYGVFNSHLSKLGAIRFHQILLPDLSRIMGRPLIGEPAADL